MLMDGGVILSIRGSLSSIGGSRDGFVHANSGRLIFGDLAEAPRGYQVAHFSH